MRARSDALWDPASTLAGHTGVAVVAAMRIGWGAVLHDHSLDGLSIASDPRAAVWAEAAQSARLAPSVQPRPQQRPVGEPVAMSRGQESPPKSGKPLSVAANKRQALKRAAAEAARLAGPVVAEPDWDCLDPPIMAAISRYRAYRITEPDWQRVRIAVSLMLAAYNPPSPKSVTGLGSIMTGYALWVADRPTRGDKTQPVTAAELLSAGLVDLYVDEGLAGVPDASRATARAVLRRTIRGLDAGPKPEKLAHEGVKPPYTPAETENHKRIALGQPTTAGTRAMCAWVGLGHGAGLDGGDQRAVTPRDITEVALPDGGTALVVDVHGTRPRRVVIRAEFEPLIRRALQLHAEQGRSDDAPLHGRELTRKNVSTPVKSAAITAYGTGVDIDANRMRTTWLLAMMNAAIPLSVLLAQAGLRSARSLAEILPYCPHPDPVEVAAIVHHLGAPPPRQRSRVPEDQLALFDAAPIAVPWVPGGGAGDRGAPE